jgi:hypothetical protein
MKEAMGKWVRFYLSFQTNPNRAQDFLVDRGQHLVQEPLCGGDL